jgi:hypothetical protein
VTGLLVDDMEQAVAATRRLIELPRQRVRATFDRRFGGRRMAEDYLALYERVAQREQCSGERAA